ncbi:hypothetical protein JOD24_003094 [Kroppenstedtia sanguinis]|uniref:hypothetical protein n=1 Tax=Kroppenstedtia sanguinis TaxID=1380684 RepID=UPI003D1949EA
MSKKKNRNYRDQQFQPGQMRDGSADKVEFGREPGAAADEVEFGREPGTAADEVEFGREPGAATDEVIFDEVTPGAPNVFDAVGYSGAGDNQDVELGEESADRNRDRLQDEDRPGAQDTETATEVAPVVDREWERNEDRADREDAGNEAGDEGRGLGITSIILSVLSFFFVPFLLGSAGIILGVIAGRKGSAMGWWAVGLGAISVILTAFVAPIAGF